VNNELERIQKCPKPNLMYKPDVSLQEMGNQTQQDSQSLHQDLYHPTPTTQLTMVFYHLIIILWQNRDLWSQTSLQHCTP